VAHGKAEN